jgi:quinol monooxygenase YgiN
MIVELRQYTLVPGRREELIELFEREFVETQEAAGITLLGLFRDLGDPDKFVWLRGFPDMPTRAEALARFYGGPAWRRHRTQANATMIDSDDVLLLRPVGDLPRSAGGPVCATIYSSGALFSDAFADFFDQRMRPLLAAAGATPLAVLSTEYAENTFPALPVREGEHTFVWLTAATDYERRLAADGRWRDEVLPILRAELLGVPQTLHLAPTRRSPLR